MNDPIPSDSPASAPEAPAPTSLLARLFNVFATPAEVFDEVKASPPRSANWLVPTLLLLVVGWLGTWLVMSQDNVKQQISDMQEKQFQKMVEKGRMTQQQLEAQRPMMEKVGSWSTQIAMLAGVPLMAFGMPFWYALLAWLVGNKVLRGEFTYMKAVEVSGLISMLLVLESVIKTLLMMTMGSLFAGPNLALLLVKDFDATNTTHGLLAAVDAMTIWQLVVRSIGLSRLSGASVGKSATWVVGLWVLVTGSFMGFGFLMQRVFGGG